MKIPETELTIGRLILALVLTALFVLNTLLFIEFRTNRFRGQQAINTNTINAMVQQLVQKGVLEVQGQQPAVQPPAATPPPEKK